MKIRLMGSPDQVKGWTDTFNKHYQVNVSHNYANQGSGREIRYIEMDDREAERVLAALNRLEQPRPVQPKANRPRTEKDITPKPRKLAEKTDPLVARLKNLLEG